MSGWRQKIVCMHMQKNFLTSHTLSVYRQTHRNTFKRAGVRSQKIVCMYMQIIFWLLTPTLSVYESVCKSVCRASSYNNVARPLIIMSRAPCHVQTSSQTDSQKYFQNFKFERVASENCLHAHANNFLTSPTLSAYRQIHRNTFKRAGVRNRKLFACTCK